MDLEEALNSLAMVAYFNELREERNSI